MEITDKDDDKAKSKKKKLQKSWKSQQRFAKLDAETQKRQASWMDFKKGKGSKKKVRPLLSAFAILLIACYLLMLGGHSANCRPLK